MGNYLVDDDNDVFEMEQKIYIGEVKVVPKGTNNNIQDFG